MVDALQNEDTKEAECYSTQGLYVKCRVIPRMGYSSVAAIKALAMTLRPTIFKPRS